MKLIKTKDEAAEEPEEEIKLDEWKKAPAAPKSWKIACTQWWIDLMICLPLYNIMNCWYI